MADRNVLVLSFYLCSVSSINLTSQVYFLLEGQKGFRGANWLSPSVAVAVIYEFDF